MTSINSSRGKLGLAIDFALRTPRFLDPLPVSQRRELQRLERLVRASVIKSHSITETRGRTRGKFGPSEAAKKRHGKGREEREVSAIARASRKIDAGVGPSAGSGRRNRPSGDVNVISIITVEPTDRNVMRKLESRSFGRAITSRAINPCD